MRESGSPRIIVLRITLRPSGLCSQPRIDLHAARTAPVSRLAIPARRRRGAGAAGDSRRPSQPARECADDRVALPHVRVGSLRQRAAARVLRAADLAREPLQAGRDRSADPQRRARERDRPVQRRAPRRSAGSSTRRAIRSRRCRNRPSSCATCAPSSPIWPLWPPPMTPARGACATGSPAAADCRRKRAPTWRRSPDVSVDDWKGVTEYGRATAGAATDAWRWWCSCAARPARSSRRSWEEHVSAPARAGRALSSPPGLRASACCKVYAALDARERMPRLPAPTRSYCTDAIWKPRHARLLPGAHRRGDAGVGGGDLPTAGACRRRVPGAAQRARDRGDDRREVGWVWLRATHPTRTRRPNLNASSAP